TRSVRLTTFALFVLLTSVGSAQQATPAAVGSLIESKVAASALKTNVLGDPAESRVAVYLPPSYQTSPQRRYPTLYLLHGFLSDIEAYTRGYQGMQLASVMDEAIARGSAREMIVVLP